MHAIGLTCLLTGFSGILAFGVLGASRNLPVALVIHASLVAIVLVRWVKEFGSIAMWWRQRVKAEYFIPPSIITAVGLVFVFAGVAIILLGTPAEGPRALNRSAIAYFGILFMFLGTGLSVIAGTDWIEKKQGKPNE